MLLDLDQLREHLLGLHTEDWEYAYRRVGPQMRVEYEARQTLRALDELKYRLKELARAKEAV